MLRARRGRCMPPLPWRRASTVGVSLAIPQHRMIEEIAVTEPTVNGHVPEAVRADHVEINQGGATSIDAQTVSITQGGAARVRANELSVSQGGVALARTGKLSLGEGGSALAVVADEVTIDSGGRVVVLLAR